jgi:hypothetical protein
MYNHVGLFWDVTLWWLVILSLSVSNYQSTRSHIRGDQSSSNILHLSVTMFCPIRNCLKQDGPPTVPWFNCFKIIKGSRDTHLLDQISYLIYYSQDQGVKIIMKNYLQISSHYAMSMLSPNFKSLCYVHELTLRIFLYFLKWLMFLYNDVTAFVILT